MKKVISMLTLSLMLAACGSAHSPTEEVAEPEVEAEQQASLASTGNSSSELAVEEAEVSKSATYTADLSQSNISFTGTKGPAFKQQGKFTDFDFSLTMEDGSPTATSVTINLLSMVTGSQGLTDHLLDPDFFEAGTWPEATFTSTSIEQVEGNTYMVDGNLTMHGQTHAESIKMTITDEYLRAVHSLDRTKYGVGAAPGGLKSIDAQVPVEIKITYQ